MILENVEMNMEVCLLPGTFSLAAGLFKMGDVSVYPWFFFLIRCTFCTEWC